jgi:hypothetical protein
MKSQTKRKRAILIMDVLEMNKGIPLSLNEWLTKINNELTSEYCLSNTKQLAHTFRYLSCAMKCNIRKQREAEHIEGYNTCNIYYSLEKEIEV